MSLLIQTQVLFFIGGWRPELQIGPGGGLGRNLHYKATVAHALLVNMFYYLTATLVYN